MHQEDHSVWQFEKEEEANVKTTRSLSGVYTFVYGNGSLIINLPSVSLAVDMPEDDIYRIKSRWKGHELYIFPPLGDKWELFAVWEDGRFVMYGNGKKKTFKKIKAEEIAPWQRNLLKPGREMWNYRYLNPDELDI